MINQDQRILVTGLANKKSIAFGVLRELREQGARIGISYFHPSNYKRVAPIAEMLEADFICETDVTDENSLVNLAETVKANWGSFDGLVHSIAFAPSEDLNGRFIDTSKEGFFKTLDISTYSLISLCKHLESFFNEDFSVVSMSYYGAQRVLPGYNVMGVAKAALEATCRYLASELGKGGTRVNCISSGPIKTLAALGIENFDTFLHDIREFAPLKKNVTIEDVGKFTSFLISNNSKLITGQVLYLDSGISIMSK